MTTPTPWRNRLPLVTENQLARDFAHLEKSVSQLEKAGQAAPVTIKNDDDLATVNTLVIDLRTERKRIDNVSSPETDRYHQAHKIAVKFFGGFTKRIDAWQDQLKARATLYLTEKANAERRAREAEEREARDEQQWQEYQAVTAAKEGKSEEAMEALAAANIAQDRADDAALAARINPAKLARTTTEAGTASLRASWAFKIDRLEDVDLNLLKPYFARGDIEKAIRRYVAANKGSRPLRGVSIFQKSNASFR